MSDWFTEKGTIGDLFHKAACRYGDAEALVFEDRRWSWVEYDAEVDRAARACMRKQRRGVRGQ